MTLFRFYCIVLLSIYGAITCAQIHQLETPTIEARNWLLIDFNSGQVIGAQLPDTRIEPASLTKLMTAYLVFNALRQKSLTLEQLIPVSNHAWQAEGSRMFIDPKKPVSVDQLLHGLIIQSGNDASIALAEAVAGSEAQFAQLMNRKAKQLGMQDSHFVNATGLPSPELYTTARDLGILVSALIRDFPEYYLLYSQKEYRYNNITQNNRNRLLWWDTSVDGVKTGFTEKAGYCLITSALRDNRRVISIILGAESDHARATESQKLLNWGFQFSDSTLLYKSNQVISEARVWKGAANTLKAGATSDLYVTVPKGRAAQLSSTIELRPGLSAPINAGQVVGTLKLTLDGKPYRDVPLLALEPMASAGFFGRLWDSFLMLFKTL